MSAQSRFEDLGRFICYSPTCTAAFSTQSKLAKHIKKSQACHTYFFYIYLPVYRAKRIVDQKTTASHRNLLNNFATYEPDHDHMDVDGSPPICSTTTSTAPEHERIETVEGAAEEDQPVANGVDMHTHWHQNVTVEDVEDEDELLQSWLPGRSYGTCESRYNKLKNDQEKRGEEPWHPFADLDEWCLVEWAMRAPLSQGELNKMLKLRIMRNRAQPSFTSKNTFITKIDKLSSGATWTAKIVRLTGDKVDEDQKPMQEDVEVWMRNPVECVEELLSNPAFKERMQFVAEWVFDGEGNCVVNEMWTADWWAEVERHLPPGSTLVPLTVLTDKTQLMNFLGNKSAWPVYLTIRNINKATRWQVSAHAQVLIRYLSIMKGEIFSDAHWSTQASRLFNYFMSLTLEPLIKADRDGVFMDCADGCICFPILAAYVAENPEQTLIACCKPNRCHTCTIPFNRCGEYPSDFPKHEQVSTASLLRAQSLGAKLPAFDKQGLHPIDKPFWAQLPHMVVCATL